MGGAERALAQLVARLNRRRFSPRVYSLGPRPAHAGLVRELEVAGVEVVFLGATSTLQFFPVVRALAREFRRQRPRLAQSFLFHANVVTRLAARRAAVPIVVSGVRVAERASRWHLWVDKATAQRVDCFVCVSSAVAEFSSAEAGLPRERMVVIPNGIDVGVYDQQLTLLDEHPLPPGRRWLAYIGRLDSQKRVDWLIDRAAEFLPQLREHDLLIVGAGPLEGRLREQVNRRGLDQRVYFLGWTADVPEILSAVDLLLLPSAWEGMPNVVLEAMASRRAVVCTAVEGVVELLGSVAEPQIAPIDDAKGFSDKVIRLAGDPALREQLAAANHARALAEFTVEKMVARYEELYESLLSGEFMARDGGG